MPQLAILTAALDALLRNAGRGDGVLSEKPPSSPMSINSDGL
jgi:hypothetical protein